jgi:uncharacterized membrane protein
MKGCSLFPFAFLIALLCVIIAFTVESEGELPPTVAVHFNQEGTPTEWMGSGLYSGLLLSCMVAVPLLIILLFAVLPRVTGGRGQIPHPEYWLGSEHRKQSLCFLFRHSCWLATMTLAAIYVIHRLIVQANGVSPPHLSTDRLFLLIIVFLTGLVWWFMRFLRHFSRV